MEITQKILNKICGAGGKDTVEVPFDELKYVHEAASLFQIGDDEVWIPFSQLEAVQGDNLIVNKWFADQEELPYD